MQKRQLERQRKYHFIYKTTNLINNKYYIGMHSTDNLDDGYIGSGSRLWRSIQYYGKENFKVEILEHFNDRLTLKKRERELVNEETIADPLCMNLALGGGYQWPLAQTPKARISRKEGIRKFWDSESGAKAKIGMAKKLRERVFSQETLDKISESAKVRMQRMKDSGEWEKIKEKNSLAHIGKIQSVDSIAKRVESIKKSRELNGRNKMSDQARSNIAKSMVGTSRNKKTWFLINSNGEKIMIENLQQWLREHECTAPTSSVVRDKNKNVIYRLERQT
jgi:hypothetical protein